MSGDSEQEQNDDVSIAELQAETDELSKTLLALGHNPSAVHDFIGMYVLGAPGLALEVFVVNGHDVSGIVAPTETGAQLLFLRPWPGLDIKHKATGLEGRAHPEWIAQEAKKLN